MYNEAVKEDTMQTYFVYVTFPSAVSAADTARALLTERLIACANLLPGVKSLYEWEGKMCEEQECVAVFKTTEARMEAMTARIKALHPYEVPCIVALPLVAGYAPFLQWIAQQTTPQTHS